MSLWQEFLTKDGKVMGKWFHYFPSCERHFAWYRNKSIVFLDIGIQNGGSLSMLQHYFGSFASIVGIDIAPRCKTHESP